jgi:hypothetical protein
MHGIYSVGPLNARTMVGLKRGLHHVGKGLPEGDKNDCNPSEYGNAVVDRPFYVHAVTSTVTATSTPTGDNSFDA